MLLTSLISFMLRAPPELFWIGYMKEVIFLLTVFLFLISCSHLQKPGLRVEHLSRARQIDVYNPDDMDRVLASDPASLSEEQFYQYEFAVIHGYSGSGGHFLEGPQIAWLRKAEAVFQARGIRLRDKWQRGYVIADSYLNNQRYDHAYEEFRAIHDQAGMELAEWFLYNKGIKNGVVSIREYSGRIPWEDSETARVVEEFQSFVAYFKGPVYRYDRRTKTHAIIYAPEDKYNWCDSLRFNGRQLVISLRDDAGVFEFDNKTHEIAERKLLNVSDLIELHKLAHPNLPLPAEEQAQ